jgi:very-short-patch-repair endonuclease
MIKFIGKTDKKSNIEPKLITLLQRELECYNIVIEMQKKGLVKTRKYVVDFYIDCIKTVIEIDGGVFLTIGSHVGKGRVKDCERDLLLLRSGNVDRIIRVTSENINLDLVRTLKFLLNKETKVTKT